MVIFILALLVIFLWVFIYYSFTSNPYIITIEGLDGSGKYTTSKELEEQIPKYFPGIDPEDVLVVSFPQYDRWHSKLVRLYLNGFFGKDPTKVPPRIASLFYAIDRFFYWHFYLKFKAMGYKCIVFDRYTTSNMVYQSMKVVNFDKKQPPNYENDSETIDFIIEEEFGDAINRAKIKRLTEDIEFLEYAIFNIPKPDIVFVLTTDSSKSYKNMASRDSKDIHENLDFLTKVQLTLSVVCELYPRWIRVDTTDEFGNMRRPEEIVSRGIIPFVDIDGTAVIKQEEWEKWNKS